MNRREFHRASLSAILTYSLLDLVGRCDAFADEVKAPARKWLKDIVELGWDLKGQKLTQLEWQKKIEELHAHVDVADVLQLIDFDKFAPGVKFLDSGARSLRVNLPKVEGIPDKLPFGQQIFALKKDRSVVPHGHNNMATAFLVLKGECRGRHYDRLQDEAKHLIVRPTIDRTFKPGEASSISDYKDNIHWFQATTETAFIYNIHLDDVRPKTTVPTGRVYIDPEGEKLSDGTIRAKILEYEDAHKLYG